MTSDRKVSIKSGKIDSFRILGRTIHNSLTVTGLSGGGTKTGGLDSTSFAILDGTDGIVAATITYPEPGWFLIIYCSNATNAVTVSLGSGQTWDGSDDRATFGTGDCLVVFGVSRTRFIIIENIGSVTFD